MSVHLYDVVLCDLQILNSVLQMHSLSRIVHDESFIISLIIVIFETKKSQDALYKKNILLKLFKLITECSDTSLRST